MAGFACSSCSVRLMGSCSTTWGLLRIEAQPFEVRRPCLRGWPRFESQVKHESMRAPGVRAQMEPADRQELAHCFPYSGYDTKMPNGLNPTRPAWAVSRAPHVGGWKQSGTAKFLGHGRSSYWAANISPREEMLRCLMDPGSDACIGFLSPWERTV